MLLFKEGKRLFINYGKSSNIYLIFLYKRYKLKECFYSCYVICKKCEIGVCFIYIIIYGCVKFKIAGFY